MSRGNEGNDIFIEDKDWKLFYKALSEISDRFEIGIFAYVLMDNSLLKVTDIKLTAKKYSAMLRKSAVYGKISGMD